MSNIFKRAYNAIKNATLWNLEWTIVIPLWLGWLANYILSFNVEGQQDHYLDLAFGHIFMAILVQFVCMIIFVIVPSNKYLFKSGIKPSKH